ncbi:MAG: FAD-dependent oxidoreductase [Spirochaetia bacterium]|jgi:glycerol-3-phosphate dehydrogenase|nr:FAD-dependent oxidoreductase [Spirochaetia bacterium]
MLVLPRKHGDARLHAAEGKIRRIVARTAGSARVIVEASLHSESILLEGELPSYEAKVEAGWAAAACGYHGVINDICVPGIAEESLKPPPVSDSLLEGAVFDVIIIGGGVIGTAIARELSKWNLSVALLEKESDVAVHTSSRNDGMVHDGFAARPGSKKAEYNVRGNRLWEPLCKELAIDFKRPGSLVLFASALSVAAYPIMADRARRNGVDGWDFWNRARVAAGEPHVTGDQHGAFYLPSAGVLSPYKATVALAESAIANGVRVILDTCVLGMELEAGVIGRIVTNRGTCRAGVVVNAAGNWSDVVAGMAGDRFFSLHQRRGTELILDAATGACQRHLLGMPRLSQLGSKTKGGGLVLTVEGNILIGPTAREVPGRENYETSPEELRELEKHMRLNTKLSMSQAITYFAGVRPCTYDEDFIIEKSRCVSNLVHAAGIQSPGLASAPAIAEDIALIVVELACSFKDVRRRSDWRSDRQAAVVPKYMPVDIRDTCIQKRPAYGRIVCRCEEISEGEIVDAIHSSLPSSTMDAIKRRTRAGMGRCHGGFCTSRVIEILARENDMSLWEVTKKGPGSELCVGPTKEGLS